MRNESDVPSPADQPSNGKLELPWESALWSSIERLREQVAEQEQELNRLRLENHTLRRRITLARERQENWLLRQQAWARERDELVRRVEEEE